MRYYVRVTSLPPLSVRLSALENRKGRPERVRSDREAKLQQRRPSARPSTPVSIHRPTAGDRDRPTTDRRPSLPPLPSLFATQTKSVCTAPLSDCRGRRRRRRRWCHASSSTSGWPIYPILSPSRFLPSFLSGCSRRPTLPQRLSAAGRSFDRSFVTKYVGGCRWRGVGG